jgi:uncharacterized protein
MKEARIATTLFALLFMSHMVIGQSDSDKLNRQLIDAAENGNADVVKVLLTQGADVEGRDGSNQTPLKVATEHARVEVVRVLLEKGANVEAKSNSKGAPLNWAVGGDGKIPRSEYADRATIVKMLLDKKASVEAKTLSGDTPLMLAASNYRNTDILQLLLNKGANIEAKDQRGITALMMAAIANNTDAETVLLARGAARGSMTRTRMARLR